MSTRRERFVEEIRTEDGQIDVRFNLFRGAENFDVFDAYPGTEQFFRLRSGPSAEECAADVVADAWEPGVG